MEVTRRHIDYLQSSSNGKSASTPRFVIMLIVSAGIPAGIGRPVCC